MGETAGIGVRHSTYVRQLEGTIYEKLAIEATRRQDEIVKGTLAGLGLPMPNTRPGNPGSGRFPVDTSTIDVELGTVVTLGQGSSARDWVVVGAGPSDRIHLARRRPNNSIAKSTRRWSDVVAANADEFRPQYSSASDAVSAVLSGHTQPPSATRNLQRLHPIARPPDTLENALELASLSGDDTFVVSNASTGLSGAIVGSPSNPPDGPARSILDRVMRVEKWYEEVAKLSLHDGTERHLMITIDSPEMIGNATAGRLGNVSVVNYGVLDHTVREQALKHYSSSRTRNLYRSDVAVMARNADLVAAHELGHIAQDISYGYIEAHLRAASTDRVIEHGVVVEALSDQLGIAFQRGARKGSRNLTALSHSTGSLPKLRFSIQRDLAANILPNTHAGTQLLNRPLQTLVRDHGWDAMAAITGDAIRSLGSEIRTGTIELLDVSVAARALRDASMNRLGVDSSTVQKMVNGWKLLKVLP